MDPSHVVNTDRDRTSSCEGMDRQSYLGEAIPGRSPRPERIPFVHTQRLQL